ncbi:hypothetical protein [Planctellipticum variicoloris]|uniref:hypothetical protein n=1 Tax=Planctellipticum variicoloris TaxID=3064265 RepID=UPI003013550D|nr:hypothetical protein SH412_001466 [Planctomycetaceae bacterium SH412]
MRHSLAWILSGAAVLGLAVAVAASGAADELKSKPKSDRAPGAADAKLRQFMREKLKHSQDVLDGLCTEDLELVEKSATKLVEMSQASDWVVIQGPVYAQHSAEFREACEQMGKMAKDNNQDGASLAYLRVTMSCMSCHKFVRSVRIAANVPDSVTPVALSR